MRGLARRGDAAPALSPAAYPAWWGRLSPALPVDRPTPSRLRAISQIRAAWVTPTAPSLTCAASTFGRCNSAIGCTYRSVGALGR